MSKNYLVDKISEATSKGELPLYMKFVEYSEWNDSAYQKAITDQSFRGAYIPDSTYKSVSLVGHLNILYKWKTFFSYQPIAK